MVIKMQLQIQYGMKNLREKILEIKPRRNVAVFSKEREKNNQFYSIFGHTQRGNHNAWLHTYGCKCTTG